jgi:hypothetical protein
MVTLTKAAAAPVTIGARVHRVYRGRPDVARTGRVVALNHGTGRSWVEWENNTATSQHVATLAPAADQPTDAYRAGVMYRLTDGVRRSCRVEIFPGYTTAADIPRIVAVRHTGDPAAHVEMIRSWEWTGA